jgi:phosphate acyltransferase
MIIAVDAAGGDYAPHEVVKGAVLAGEEYGIEIALVGKKSILHVLAAKYLKKEWLSIVDASEVIEFNEHPIKAVTNKPDSSIVVGINLLKTGGAAAFVSAGHSGAVFAAAFLILGKMEGIERPAICATLDITGSTPVILIDAGANADCKPPYLVQFAEMGSLFAHRVLGIQSPRVGLLNVGEEETKGNHLAIESHELLKSSGLNFIGNIEGHDIPKRKADVVVTDGFTGNIVLKTIEGMGEAVQDFKKLSQSISASSSLHGRALTSSVGLSSRAKKLDFTEYGGACLLGVNGNVIIAHGRSHARAIKNAIGLAKMTTEGNMLELSKKENINGKTDSGR